MSGTEQKILATKYLLQCFGKWYQSKRSDINDLSILKSLKLIFFTCSMSTQEDRNLLDHGFSFSAMPLGHVESDIYSYYKNGDFSSIIDNKSIKMEKLMSEDFSDLRSPLKSILDKSIKSLQDKNDHLILESASSLVELSHKHSSWINNFHKAQTKGTLSHPIANIDIITEEKFYFI
ncbi:hypothetical protein [Sphingobacterium multivorum]|uniref:hypothetical protein n=1 Tax=Sphingobacterium multivorum TaxID=28454 RepID=UPI0028A78FDF|nr:hypothetical protein [Sphingobacterium multivorum]